MGPRNHSLVAGRGWWCRLSWPAEYYIELRSDAAMCHITLTACFRSSSLTAISFTTTDCIELWRLPESDYTTCCTPRSSVIALVVVRRIASFGRRAAAAAADGADVDNQVLMFSAHHWMNVAPTVLITATQWGRRPHDESAEISCWPRSFAFIAFLPWRRYASEGTIYGAMALCPCLCLSVSVYRK